MLFGLMLKSANDVAHALGRDNAGTMEAFAEKMTRRARELGATRTSFRNPHGLHHVEHFTTARDLAIIARAAMQQPFFRQIVSTRGYRVGPPGRRDLGAAQPQPPARRVPGLHRGSRPASPIPRSTPWSPPRCATGREVIAAVLYDTRQGKWEDSKLLLTYGFNHPPEPGKPAPQY